MRAVFGLVLIVGLGLAGFAVYMAQSYFATQSAALEQERAAAALIVPTVDVYAVKRDVAYGERLKLDDVQVIKYAAPFLPEGVFRTEEEMFPSGGEILRSVLIPMSVNEPVLAAKVSAPGEDAGITTRLARGMRAFAIKVDVASGVSGFLRPSDRVDVYWSGRNDTGSGEAQEITKLIETGVKIVGIDQTSDGNISQASIARTVTVEVTPQQVAALAQAQSTGTLSLSLVGSADDTVAEVSDVDQRSLLGIQDQVIVQAEEEKICSIKTRRGAEVVEIVIPCATN
jgi:pilus assembly protein CpaB